MFLGLYIYKKIELPKKFSSKKKRKGDNRCHVPWCIRGEQVAGAQHVQEMKHHPFTTTENKR